MSNQPVGDVMQFSDETEFFDTINQWVRDGSNLIGFMSSWAGDSGMYSATLIGTDGAIEDLVLVIRDV